MHVLMAVTADVVFTTVLFAAEIEEPLLAAPSFVVLRAAAAAAVSVSLRATSNLCLQAELVVHPLKFGSSDSEFEPMRQVSRPF